MFVVIFRAKIAELDNLYAQTAMRMRTLAEQKYGCLEFTSLTEGDEEISISYWSSLEQIMAWKIDAKHLAAQELGKSKWYRWYKVQIAEIAREYENHI